MKTKHLLRMAAVALSALTVSTASAQFSTFPPLSKPGTEKSRSTMQRVSPNLDKESGIMMYAATSADGTMYNSWVSLRSKQASTLTRYFSWLDYTGHDDVYRSNVLPATGAYNPDDGKYYVMLTFVYDCIWDAKGTFNYLPQHWYSIDLDNDAKTPVEIRDLTEWSKEQGWTSYSMDPNAPHWGLWMDMSFDPIDGTMYAMAQSEQAITEDNPFHSAIVQVQLHDGSYRVKKELAGYYLGFTYDLDGKVYAARWIEGGSGQIVGSAIVELDRDTFEEKGVVAELYKDGAPFKLCYNGTLDVDRATGELYYAGADYDGGRQYMFKVNPKTGNCECLSSLSYDNIVGLHIPYVGTESRNAPARVSNLFTEFAPDGSNSITIKWTNPSTQWNLEDLTSISGVKIYRDDMNGEPIADVKENVAPGTESSYVDNTATQGLHTYYLIPYNENGDGISDSIAAFVGKDTPDAPINVDGYGSGTFSMIQWAAPVTGLHNGWFDNTTIEYKVTRSDGVVVAEHVTDNYAYDNMLSDAPMAMYTYTVTSSNADGEGGSAESKGWLCGASYTAPYTFDFTNQSERSGFTGYSPAGWSNWTNSSWNPEWYLYTDSPSKYDEYLLTPGFSVEAGHTYRVTWNLSFDGSANVHTYELTSGESGETQKAFAEDMFDETETGQVYQVTSTSAEYTAEADGKCMFGFHVTTEGAQWDGIRVIGMSVEEVLDNDVQAKSLNGFPRILRGKAQDYTVSVFNSGRNDHKDFKVQTGYQTRRGDFVVLGETTCSETVPSNETRTVHVPTTVDFENGTVVDLRGRVIVEGDEYTGNDVSPITTVVVEDIEGADAFNAEFVGNKLFKGDGYGDSNVPFTTYDPNTTTVTIYPKSLLTTSQVAPYEISRIGYVGFNKMAIGPCDIKVYIGETEDEMFTDYPVSNVINPSDLELVYEGTTTAMNEGFDGTSIQFAKPYYYEGNKNLVVAVEVVCNYGTGDWNISWNTWDREVGMTQSLRTNNPEWDPSKVFTGDGLPDLHLAVKGQNIGDGVEGISSESAFSMSINGRNVFVSGNAKALYVYDLTGRKVSVNDVNGSGNVTLNVPDGIYLIKAVDANGNSRTLKAAVR